MTKIIYKQGDLFNSGENYIAHGCNMQGVMGAGFAALIAKKFPKSVEHYKKLHSKNALLLGDVYPFNEDGIMILHCMTQEFYGRGKVYVSYKAVQSCMRLIDITYPGIDIAMPKIGAGLAGGDWKIIEEIIEQESTNFQPIVYIL